MKAPAPFRPDKTQNPVPRGIRSLSLFATMIAIAAAGCSLQDIGFEDNATQFQLPASDQFALDLPRSLAPRAGGPAPSDAALAAPLPCDSSALPGELFACVTRFTFGEIVVGLSNEMSASLTEISNEIENYHLPQGITFTFEHDPFDVEVLWETNDGVTDHHVAFMVRGSSEKVGQWDWTIDADGAASGEFIMLAAVLSGNGKDGPRGLRYAFTANAAGDEKSLLMEIDLGESPPIADRYIGPPTRLRMTAVRAADAWTVLYGMYHPAWIPGTPDDVPTLVLVSAVGGVAGDAPAVMKLVALQGDASSVPSTADEDDSICDYVVPIYEVEGWLPPGVTQCDDNNPLYVAADGSVQEGGPSPPGFGLFASILSGVAFVTEDPSEIRNLTVDIE